MEEEKKGNRLYIRIIEEIISWIIALILALLTRYYFGAPTLIKYSSMAPTLQDNQRVWTSRLDRIIGGGYERGDVVTFEAPSGTQTQRDLLNPVAEYNNQPQKLVDKLVYYVLELNKVSYIKRIIAVEGDWVQIKEGKVYINGELLEEEYLTESTITMGDYYHNVIVPEGYVYVMGDNREKSMDSRSFGCIPIEKIEGKVLFIYWPLNQISGL